MPAADAPPWPDELAERLRSGGLLIRAKDGDLYRLRHIRTDDADSLMRGYDAMSERAKWFRMLHALPHLTHEMAQDFCTVDPASECCAVVEGHDALQGEVLGGARVAGLAPGGNAEFSVSVRPEAQGLGVARQALEAMIEVARQAHCQSVFGIIARSNRRMLALARRLGFRIETDPDDRRLMLARLQLGTPGSIAPEPPKMQRTGG